MPDKFFVTLRGSVMVLIRKTKEEVAEDEKILKKLLQKTKGKFKEGQSFKIANFLTEKNGFGKDYIQRYCAMWDYCKNKKLFFSF